MDQATNSPIFIITYYYLIFILYFPYSPLVMKSPLTYIYICTTLYSNLVLTYMFLLYDISPQGLSFRFQGLGHLPRSEHSPIPAARSAVPSARVGGTMRSARAERTA